MLTFNNITAKSFAADTQQGAGRKRPRHREALSCSQCRSRKVRCDRKLPCKQCQARGNSSSCSYSSNKDTNHNGNGSNHGNNSQQNHQQQRKAQTEPSSPLSSASAESDVRRRLDRLELLLAASSASNSQHFNANGHDELNHRDFPSVATNSTSRRTKNALQCPQGPLLSAKTRFIGGTHWLAACNNMAVLKAMLNKSSEFDSSYKSFAEIKAWTKSLNAVSMSLSTQCIDATSIFGLLPSQSTCESWIQTYRQTYRHIYGIVDDIALNSIMDKVWYTMGNRENPILICIVVLLVCVGMQSDETERLTGRRIARCVERFAFSSGLLQKPCIGSMKVLLLLTLLKTIACSDTESLDSLSAIMGMTTQVALAMGLHRNPSTFGNMTSYHSEIRKRLWSVFFRLSYEHCMRTGIPMALHSADGDVGFPTNVSLAEIASEVDSDVEGRELHHATDATFSIIAARLAHIAAPYQRAICSSGNLVSSESVERLRDECLNLLTEAPPYMRPKTQTANMAEEIQQAFLTIGMHSTSLILSLHFVINGAAEAVQEQHLLTVWKHALSVLQHFQNLSQKPRHIQTLAYQLLWSDACRAAFSAGMVITRLQMLESTSIVSTRMQHTLIPFQEALVKYLTFMSRFWFQRAHLGAMASKNCLLLAAVVAVTSRLFSDDTDISAQELLEVGARSVEQTVEQMKAAMKRRHSFPFSPEPTPTSTSHSARACGENGRSVSSPNMAENWSTTANFLPHSRASHNNMMDHFASSLGVFGYPYVTPPDPSSVGWTPQEMQWPMDPFEYNATSASMSPVSHVLSRQTTASTYVDSLISPSLADWNGPSYWVDDVGMS